MASLRFNAIVAHLALGTASISYAQTAPADPATAADAGQVSEIVVTAQRRSENLQRVPIAVTALSTAQLTTAGIRTTSGLTQITPALTLSNVAGFVEPRIRGIGNASAGPGVENSIAAYVDGVYISSAPGSLMSLSNVERVEVLKGPQGTLFGRNATGGLIQIVTRDPGSNFAGEAHAGYGNYKTLNGDLYLSTPLADGTAIDLAVSGSHQGDGYGKSVITGEEINKTTRDIAARSKLVSHIGDATTLRLSVDYANQSSSDPSPVPLSGTATTAYRTAAPASTPIILVNDPWDGNINGRINHKTETGGASLRLDHEFDGVTLTSISAYRKLRFDQAFDADFSPAPNIYEIYVQKDRQISQEVQLASRGNDKLHWMVGAYYFNLHAQYNPFELQFGLPPTRTFTDLRDKSYTESFAGFGQATYEILPDTNLTGGFRYTIDKRRLTGTTTATNAAGAQTVTVFPGGKTTYKTPTWRISLDHNFSPDVMAYLSWNRGYKSGGYNAQSPTAPAYKPEKLDAYEAGVKSVLFDRHLRLNAAAFLYDYSDIQVNTYIGSLGVIYNGAKARLYGIDADFDLAVSERLHFTGGVVLLHDRFKDFQKAVVATPVGNGLYTVAPGDATGNRLPYAADATIHLGGSYTLPIGDGSAILAVNDLHSSGYKTQPDNVLSQHSYDQLGASLTWKPDDRYSVKIWGNNLLNKAVAVYKAIATTATAVSYQPPRTYGVEVGVKF